MPLNGEIVRKSLNTSIIDFASSFTGKIAILYYHGPQDTWLPSADDDYIYGTFIVENTGVAKLVRAYSWNGKKNAYRIYGNNTWQDWIITA